MSVMTKAGITNSDVKATADVKPAIKLIKNKISLLNYDEDKDIYTIE